MYPETEIRNRKMEENNKNKKSKKWIEKIEEKILKKRNQIEKRMQQG